MVGAARRFNAGGFTVQRAATPARRIGVPFAVAAAVVVLDQAIKAAVASALGPDQPDHRVEVLGRLLALEYVQNTGAAFGTLRGQGVLLSAMALLTVGALVAYYRTLVAPSHPMVFALGLLLGGAAGNLVDRLRLGYVVDFVAVGVWPKFNLADAAITVGVVLLGWHLLLPQPDPDPEPAAQVRHPHQHHAQRQEDAR
ncbi:MAG: Lipoprotein signal peptidase [uncultured Thermomicrobiales bacterium]|uniref:Lipoprotein signal peptidase n=1 Tax=uncultured Thermomicrobiales bacterium TaxID=1645740 RepID=A0A6J4U7S6_9BACT|nr:MAG: Lipoprotein signal peptidase [uncultured Thermomicrobiales bacterium]